MKMARSGVYVLRLEGGRYYVGSSSDIALRVAAHRAGTGAAFTRRYGVVEEVEPRTERTPDVESWERAETLARMREHGFESVRGWLYTTVRRSASQRAGIREQTRERFGQCRRCGESGHYIASCALRRDGRRDPCVLSEARLERESVYGDYDTRGGHGGSDVNAEERGASDARDDPKVRAGEAADELLLRDEVERVELAARAERRA